MQTPSIQNGKSIGGIVQSWIEDLKDLSTTGAFVIGYPAIEHTDWKKAAVVLRQLPSMKKRIEELEQRIAELEEKPAACQTPSDR